MRRRHAALTLASVSLCATVACRSQTAIAIRIPDGAATSTATSDGAIQTQTRTATSTSTTTSADSGTQNPDTDAAPLPQGLPFSDNFGGGYEVNWISEAQDPPPMDVPLASNAYITLDSTSSLSGFSRIHSSQQFSTANISASVKLRIEQAPTSTRMVRLDVRQSADTPNVFYAVGASVAATDGTITKVSLFKKVPDTNNPGNYTICALVDPSAPNAGKFATPVPFNEWHTIKITISGTASVSLAAYYDGVLMATFVDDCTSDLTPTGTNKGPVSNPGCLADQTGLGIQIDKEIIASFDDVLVTSP